MLAEAVTVTVEPWLTAPPPLTMPPAGGFALTVTVYWLRAKVAVTALAPVIVSEQLLAPPHAPDQPSKVEPVSAAAVSVTCVFRARPSVQARPQSMPAGALVTFPLPVPVRETVSGTGMFVRLKIAGVNAPRAVTVTP